MRRWKIATVSLLLTLWIGVASPQKVSAAKKTRIQKYPNVVKVDVRLTGENTFDFDVTVSSPYDTPKRYADAFRVKGPGGKVYGTRKILHDHQTEQPFTRDLYNVGIPADTNIVTVQARDQKYGYGGKVLLVSLPRWPQQFVNDDLIAARLWARPALPSPNLERRRTPR